MRISDWSSDVCASDLEGGQVVASYGKYSAGDGDRSRIQGDIGFALGANGWLRVSAEVADQEPTNRAGLDNRPGFTELGKKYQVGIPNSHSYNTFFNWGYDFTPNVSLYGSAHYGMLMAEPMAFYRRSEEHTSELQSLMRISYAVFCLKKQKIHNNPYRQNKKTNRYLYVQEDYVYN